MCLPGLFPTVVRDTFMAETVQRTGRQKNARWVFAVWDKCKGRAAAWLSLSANLHRLARAQPGAHVDRVARSDGRYMANRRADYYAYLSALLAATDGRRSLRDFFLDDLARFGLATPRGRVSAVWHIRFERSGGSLAQAWAGVFPDDDLALIDVAQNEGARALPAALADLARTTRLLQGVRHTLLATCATGVVACLVVIAMLASMPTITVPRIQRVFESVPSAYWGPATRALYAAADLFIVLAPALAACLALTVATLWWCLPRWSGATRMRLDSFPVFRLYRDFQAIRFLCALVLVIGDQKHTDLRMRDGLDAVAGGASPWMSNHLATMARRMGQGATQSEVFDTGLFDQETFWFMSDVMQARGLGPGLAQARERIENSVAAAILSQSRVLRWLMLLTAVACALGIAFWHFATLDELRRALAYSLTAR